MPESYAEVVKELIRQASVPANQHWVTLEDLKKAAEKLDDDQKQRLHS